MKREVIQFILLISILCFFNVTGFVSAVNEKVIINEFVTDSQTDWGNSNITESNTQWLELYNNETFDVDLSGWNLTSISPDARTKTLNQTILAGGYLLIKLTNVQNDGRIELYNSVGELSDAVSYGDFNDGDASDNAPDGNSQDIYDECLARYPNSADTDVDAEDFIKTKCTPNSENNFIFKEINITDFPAQPSCILETDNLLLSAEITGSIESVYLYLNVGGSWDKIFLSGAEEGIYSYTVDSPNLTGNSEVKWYFSVTNLRGEMSHSDLNTVHINSITTLEINPSQPDGLNDWYISEPKFSLLNPNAAEINYRWNGNYFLYDFPFGLEGTLNNGNITGGTHALFYWGNYLDTNCSEPEREFVGKFDFKKPLIKSLVPSPNETVYEGSQITINAYLDEIYQGNSGINTSSVTLEIDGAKVDALVEKVGLLDATVSYTAELSESHHVVTLSAEDNAGQSSEKTWEFDLTPLSEFLLTVNSPTDGIYMERRIPFNITTTRKSEEISYIDYNEPSPRFRVLCKDCDDFGDDKERFKSLREGENRLTIRAQDPFNGLFEKNISIIIDSSKPRIIQTKPTSGFASGLFEIEFEEENPLSLKIIYGNEQTGGREHVVDFSSECENDRNYKCSTLVDLSDYDGQQISYSALIEDIAGNTDQSRERTLDLDISPPAINSLNVDVEEKFVTFTLDVTESYLEKITYTDNSAERPTEKTLCFNLEDSICSKRVTFSEGPHNVTITVKDRAGGIAEASTFFVTDSKDPVIKKTEPLNGFASGTFSVLFEETNPASLFLNYGNLTETRAIQTNLAACSKDKKNTFCSISTTLEEFEGQDIYYWFNLTDFADRYDESDVRELKVDSIPPKVENFSYSTSFREITFFLNITEQNFEKVEYQDRTDSNPKFKTLCSRLVDGICEKSLRLRPGNHLFDIRTRDKAGNEVTVVEKLLLTI